MKESGQSHVGKTFGERKGNFDFRWNHKGNGITSGLAVGFPNLTGVKKGIGEKKQGEGNTLSHTPENLLDGQSKQKRESKTKSRQKAGKTGGWPSERTWTLD